MSSIERALTNATLDGAARVDVAELARLVREHRDQRSVLDGLTAQVAKLGDERDAARAAVGQAQSRPTIDQARGALGWLLSHWFGDEGDTSGNMPGEYDQAREILGDGNVEQLAKMLTAPRTELRRCHRVITEYVEAVEDGEKFGALVELVPGLVSDDGQYGAADADPWVPVIGRVRVADGGAS